MHLGDFILESIRLLQFICSCQVLNLFHKQYYITQKRKDITIQSPFMIQQIDFYLFLVDSSDLYSYSHIWSGYNHNIDIILIFNITFSYTLSLLLISIF